MVGRSSFACLAFAAAAGCSSSPGGSGIAGNGASGTTQQSGSVAASGATPSNNSGSASGSPASGVGSGAAQAASRGGASAGTAGGAASGSTSASGAAGSGAAAGSIGGGAGVSAGSSQAGSGTASAGTTSGSAAPSSGVASGSEAADSGPLSLPAGAPNDVPTGYTGTAFMGTKAQIPGVVYARNYDVGGQGVGFNHPGATDCGDWPANMAMYRTGADCVGLSVENAQKPDVTVDGGPADYGEIYVSYCATDEWLDYTLEVLQSGTYSVSLNVGAPANLAVSFAFSTGAAFSSATAFGGPTTGKLEIPASVDEAQPGHEMYHVWQVVPNAGTLALEAGIYVMRFTILDSQANFDTFTFTKM